MKINSSFICACAALALLAPASGKADMCSIGNAYERYADSFFLKDAAGNDKEVFAKVRVGLCVDGDGVVNKLPPLDLDKCRIVEKNEDENLPGCANGGVMKAFLKFTERQREDEKKEVYYGTINLCEEPEGKPPLSCEELIKRFSEPPPKINLRIEGKAKTYLLPDGRIYMTNLAPPKGAQLIPQNLPEGLTTILETSMPAREERRKLSAAGVRLQNQ